MNALSGSESSAGPARVLCGRRSECEGLGGLIERVRAGCSAALVVSGEEQCLRPVDDREGSYPPDHLQALKQDRRANAGREGTTLAHRSSWSRRRR
jgi:hypothetical protein